MVIRLAIVCSLMDMCASIRCGCWPKQWRALIDVLALVCILPAGGSYQLVGLAANGGWCLRNANDAGGLTLVGYSRLHSCWICFFGVQVLAVLGRCYLAIVGAPHDDEVARSEVETWRYLPAFMFALLVVLLFSGIPVGLVLAGTGLLVAIIGAVYGRAM